MRTPFTHPARCFTLLLSLWTLPESSSGQLADGVTISDPQESSVRISTTAEGVRFGFRGKRRTTPAATVFLFGSLMDELLAGDSCQRLEKAGFLCVTLDAPGHGADHDVAEPWSLVSWRHRLKGGKNFIATFNHKVSGVLDHLVSEGAVDPRRVAALGESRGGFLAFHFAASDKRVQCVVGLAPVTELRTLSEFDQMQDHRLTRSLSLVRHAASLADRDVLVMIGDQDARVGTDDAVAFARRVSQVAPNARVDLHVLFEPRGHYLAAEIRPQVTAWIVRHLGQR